MGSRAAAAVFLLVALCSPRSAQAGCSGGRYSNTCSAGNYCDTDWWDTCESMSNCPGGYYRPQYYQGSNQPSCQPCPANSWCNGNSNGFATACPTGTFSKPLSTGPGFCQPASPPPPPPSPSPPPPPPVLSSQCANSLVSGYYNDGAGKCYTNGCTQGMCCSSSGWCGTSSAYCGAAAPKAVQFANSAYGLCLVATGNTVGSAVTAATCSATNPQAAWAWGNTFVNNNYNAVLRLNGGPLCLGCTAPGCGAGTALQLVACAQAPTFNNNGPNYAPGVLAANMQSCLTYTNGKLTTAQCASTSPSIPAPAEQRWVGCAPPQSPPPPPSPSPPSAPVYLLGNIPISYFSDYSATNVQNAPYTLQFSKGLAYNVGTQYLLGHMATATETLNTFSIPIVGGAGPCPNGAMRSGQLKVTCSASTTSFSVNENPMCTYDMQYVTTQACPPGTVFPSPPPPPPSPSPPPPTVYTSRKVNIGAKQYTDKVTGGPTQHVLNGGATTSSTETTADGKVLKYATTTTTDATQQTTGHGHIKAQSTSTTTSDVDHPQTFVKHNSPPPPPPTVYTSARVLDQTTGFGPKVTGGPNQHVLNGGATTTSTETTANGNVLKYVTTTTTDATQQGTGNGHIKAQATDSSTTATDHQQTYQKHNTHTTTTDLPAPAVDSVPAAPAVCLGKSFAVQSGAKSALCMHVKGAMGPGGFVVSSTVKRPIITMPCTPGSPNQQFSWMPTENGGVLVHTPSSLAMSLASVTVSDGTGVVLAAETGAPTQEWVWSDPATGGTIASVANENFMITDSRVNADVSVGLPVHMWHLAASLPSGAPNAQWYANCGN